MISTSITSTNIREAHWEAERMVLGFNNGRFYEFLGVPLSVFNEFTEAPSQGKFFHANIKNSYAATELQDFSPVPAA